MAIETTTHDCIDAEEPAVRSGEGIWICGECKFLSTTFEGLERHVYEKHLGVTSS